MKLPPYVENIVNFLGEKEEKYLGNPAADAAKRIRQELIDESLTAKNPAPRDPEKKTKPEISAIKNPLGKFLDDTTMRHIQKIYARQIDFKDEEVVDYLAKHYTDGNGNFGQIRKILDDLETIYRQAALANGLPLPSIDAEIVRGRRYFPRNINFPIRKVKTIYGNFIMCKGCAAKWDKDPYNPDESKPCPAHGYGEYACECENESHFEHQDRDDVLRAARGLPKRAKSHANPLGKFLTDYEVRQVEQIYAKQKHMVFPDVRVVQLMKQAYADKDGNFGNRFNKISEDLHMIFHRVWDKRATHKEVSDFLAGYSFPFSANPKADPLRAFIKDAKYLDRSFRVDARAYLHWNAAKAPQPSPVSMRVDKGVLIAGNTAGRWYISTLLEPYAKPWSGEINDEIWVDHGAGAYLTGMRDVLKEVIVSLHSVGEDVDEYLHLVGDDVPSSRKPKRQYVKLLEMWREDGSEDFIESLKKDGQWEAISSLARKHDPYMYRKEATHSQRMWDKPVVRSGDEVMEIRYEGHDYTALVNRKDKFVALYRATPDQVEDVDWSAEAMMKEVGITPRAEKKKFDAVIHRMGLGEKVRVKETDTVKIIESLLKSGDERGYKVESIKDEPGYRRIFFRGMALEKSGLTKPMKNPRLSRGRSPKEFDQEELRRGTKHEMEHTDDEREAQRIAMDHLVEDPKYYTRLDKCLIKNPRCAHRLLRDLHVSEVLRIVDMLPDKIVDKREKMIKKFRELKKPEYAAMLEQISDDDWHDFVVNHAECVHWGTRHNPSDAEEKIREAAKKMLALNEHLPEEYRFTQEELEDLRRDAGEVVESQNPTRPSVAELGKVFKEKNTITWEDPKTKQKKKIQVPGFLDSNFAEAIRANPNLSKKEKDERLEESWREIELFIQKMVDTSLESVMRLRLEQSAGGEPGARPLPGALEFPSKRDRRFRPEERVEIMEDVERNRYYKLLLTTYLMSLLRKFFFLDRRTIMMIEEQLGGDKPRLQKRLYGNREAFAQSMFTGMVALTGRVNPVNLLRWLQANEPTVKDAYASANERWAKIQEAYGKKGKKEADARREAREKERTSIEDLAPEERRDEGKRDLAELSPQAEAAASATAAPRAPRPKQESATPELIAAVRSLSKTWPDRQKGVEQKRKATPHRGIAGRKRGQESA